jgi:hypothetical protein
MLALKRKPCATLPELALITGITPRSLAHTCKEMVAEGKIYIIEWTSAKSTATGVYAIGNKPSAPQPTRKEIQEIRQEKKGLPQYDATGYFDPANPRCDLAASWIRRVA